MHSFSGWEAGQSSPDAKSFRFQLRSENVTNGTGINRAASLGVDSLLMGRQRPGEEGVFTDSSPQNHVAAIPKAATLTTEKSNLAFFLMRDACSPLWKAKSNRRSPEYPHSARSL